MKYAIWAMGAASFLSVATPGYTQSDPMAMMTNYANCNTGYMQCLQSADYAIASSPQEGMSKFQANMSHATECANQLHACYRGGM